MAGLDRVLVHSHVFCVADHQAHFAEKTKANDRAIGIDRLNAWCGRLALWSHAATELGWTAARPGGRRQVCATPGLAKQGQAGPTSRALLPRAGPGRAGPCRARQPPSLERRSLTRPSPAQRGVVVQQLRTADAFGLIKHDNF